MADSADRPEGSGSATRKLSRQRTASSRIRLHPHRPCTVGSPRRHSERHGPAAVSNHPPFPISPECRRTLSRRRLLRGLGTQLEAPLLTNTLVGQPSGRSGGGSSTWSTGRRRHSKGAGNGRPREKRVPSTGGAPNLSAGRTASGGDCEDASSCEWIKPAYSGRSSARESRERRLERVPRRAWGFVRTHRV